MSRIANTLTQLCGTGLLVAGAAVAGAGTAGAAPLPAGAALPAATAAGPGLAALVGPSVPGRPTAVALRVFRLAPGATVAVSDLLPGGVSYVPGSARAVYADGTSAALADPQPVTVDATSSSPGGTLYAWSDLHLPSGTTSATVILVVRAQGGPATATPAATWTDVAYASTTEGAVTSRSTVPLVPVAATVVASSVAPTGHRGAELVTGHLDVTTARTGTTGEVTAHLWIPGWAAWIGCPGGSSCTTPVVTHVVAPVRPGAPDLPVLAASTQVAAAAHRSSAGPDGSGHDASPSTRPAHFTELTWTWTSSGPSAPAPAFRIWAAPTSSPRTALLATAAGLLAGAPAGAPPVGSWHVQAWPVPAPPASSGPAPSGPAPLVGTRPVAPWARPAGTVVPATVAPATARPAPSERSVPAATRPDHPANAAAAARTGRAAKGGAAPRTDPAATGSTNPTAREATTATTAPTTALAAGDPARDPFASGAAPAATSPPATTPATPPTTSGVGAAAVSVRALATTGIDARRAVEAGLGLLLVGGIILVGSRRPAASYVPVRARARRSPLRRRR